MKTIYLLFTILAFAACQEISNKQNTESKISVQLDIPDTTNKKQAYRDINSYFYTRELTKSLSLKGLENGADSFELRLWNIGSMWDPIVMYILKGNDTNWTCFHYQLFRGDRWNSPLPFIDSLIVNSVKPGKGDWKHFINKLDTDSLWQTPFQWQVVPSNFSAVDGSSIVVELADRKRYKYLHYYVPYFLADKEPNNRRISFLPEKFRKSLVYKDMINL